MSGHGEGAVNVDVWTPTLHHLTRHLRARVGRKRMTHVMGVAHAMMTLAQAHGLDAGRAAVAALLHDLSKELSNHELRHDLERWGRPLAHEDLDYPRTWHGFHAVQWARHVLGLDDGEIDEAVALHTTADAGIGPLARALFVADFCSPDRKVDVARPFLARALADLDDGFRTVLEAKLRHVREVKRTGLHPRAVRAMHAFLPAETWLEIEKSA